MLYFRTAERALLHLPCWKSEQGHGKEIFVQKYPLAVPSRHDRREYSGIMHNQTADKVPIRYRREYQHGNEQRTNSEKVKMKHERSKRKLKIELRKNSEKTQRTEGEQWKMSVYSVQIRAFLGVFCVRYIIILPMPLQRRTEPQRAVITHSESSIIKTCCKYQFLQTVWRIRATPHFTTFHIIWQCFNNVCIVLIRNQTDSTQHTTNLMK